MSSSYEEFSFTPNFHVREDRNQERSSQKRNIAANFIEALLPGTGVPAHSDEAFRSALADGATLCRLMNIISPGSIHHIANKKSETSPPSSARQAFENVANFIQASCKVTTETFSVADLEETGDISQVIECILSLQDHHHHSLLHSPALSSTLKTSTPLPALPNNTSSSKNSGFTPHAVHLVQKHSSDQQDGLDYLMQACTHMLKTRMGLPATPLSNAHQHLSTSSSTNPEIALDAVGPILETVLSNLTSEYEKRLLDKDREQRHLLDTVARLQRQLETIQTETTIYEQKKTSKGNTGNDALKAQERAEYERLVEAEKSLVCELAAKRREIETLRAESTAQLVAAGDQVAVLHAELDKYRDMHKKYKTLQAENRSLYNIVQDLRGAIRVFCRIRPRGITGDASSPIVEVGEEGKLAVYSAKHSKWHEFTVDRVFGEHSTQSEIYEETKPLVRSVLDGYNVCIFCYGQTGSGKTYTMSASGINTRALHDLFEQRDERMDEVQYTIRVQLLEVYNENVRDLLAVGSDVQRSLSIVSTLGSGANVPDATTIEVRCAEDVEKVMERGAKNRATAETKMNDRSSRSHQVLTVLVDGVDLNTRTSTFGCLNLIDLAGSERVARSGAAGQQLLEAQHINKSLTALGCVMQALAQKRNHIPFRDSKLTQLIQDSLVGQAKSMMFIHIAPEASSISETMSTLHFGKQVTEITLGAAKRNTESGQVWEMREMLSTAQREAADAKIEAEALREEVQSLKKQAVAYKTGFKEEKKNSNDNNVQIAAYRPETAAEMTATATPTLRLTQRTSFSKIPSYSADGDAAKYQYISSHGSNSYPDNAWDRFDTTPVKGNAQYEYHAGAAAALDQSEFLNGSSEGFHSLAAAAAHGILLKSKSFSLARSNSGIGGGIARVYSSSSRRESRGRM